MGYGIVYLGSLRNDVARVKEILDLPEYAFPFIWNGCWRNQQMMKMVHLNHVYRLNMYSIKTLTIAMLKNKEAIQKYDEEISGIIKNVRMENVKKHGHNKLLGS